MRLFLPLLSFLSGCATVPRTRVPGSLPGTPEAVVAAGGALWPIMLASFLCMLGGAALFVYTRNWRLLAAGVGMALVPPLFHMFLQPVAPYVAWMLLVAGGAGLLAGLSVLAYRVYDYIRDEERRSNA